MAGTTEIQAGQDIPDVIRRVFDDIFEKTLEQYESGKAEWPLVYWTDLDGDKIKDVTCVPCQKLTKPEIAKYVGNLLAVYPVVVNVTEAWMAPPEWKGRPSQCEQRQEIVLILVYSGSSIYSASCPIITEGRKKTVERAELLKLSGIEGQMAVTAPQTH